MCAATTPEEEVCHFLPPRDAARLVAALAEAMHLAHSRNLVHAEAVLCKVIDLDPRLNEAYYNLGSALMRQARFDEAAASLKKASDLLPAMNPGRGWARQLQQQCQRYSALDTRLPAILQGIKNLAKAAEQIEFAQLVGAGVEVDAVVPERVAGFYDVGNTYVQGHQVAPVAHGVGIGLRLDMAWLSFVERSTLRLDVARSITTSTGTQVWLGINQPF
jgi:tetratricopeptide (TPR) repeat protein